MPAFDTPEPISVTIELAAGDVRIDASDRTDTVVHVRPSDPSYEPDVRAAEQTRVEYAAGRLLVAAPKPRALSLFGKPGSVDVPIEMPAGSRVQGDAAAAAFRGTGRLGECRVKAALGDLLHPVRPRAQPDGPGRQSRPFRRDRRGARVPASATS